MNDARRRDPTAPSDRGERWWAVAAPALLALVVLGLLHAVLPRDRALLHGDNLVHSVPLHLHYARMIGGEGWRFWSANEAFGFPRFAEATTGWLHPFTWLVFRLLPGLDAHDAFAALSLWIAGLAALGIARTHGLSSAASLLAGVLVVASTTALTLPYNAAYASAFAWGGVLLWRFERWDARRTPRNVAALALAIALSLLAGYPPLTHAGLLFAGVSLLVRVLQEPATLMARALGLGFAGVLGVALAAPQVLPMLELAGQSARAEGAATLAHMAWQGILAGTFLVNDPALYVQGFDVTASLGSVVALVAVAVLPLARDERPLVAIATAAVFAGIASGPGSPVHDALRPLVPGLDRLRFFHPFAWATTLPLAIAVAQVLDAASVARVGRWRGLACLAAALAAVGLALFSLRSVLPRVEYATAMAVVLGASLVLLSLGRALGRPRAALLALAFLVCVEAATTKRDYVRGFDVSLLETERAPARWLAERAADDPGARVASFRDRWYRMNVARAVFSGSGPPGYEKQIAFCRRAICPNLGLLDDLPSWDAQDSLPLARRMAVDGLMERETKGESTRAPGERLIDWMRVRFLLAASPDPQGRVAEDLVPVWADEARDVLVLENRARRGAASFTDAVERVPSMGAAVARLRAGETGPEPGATRVVIEDAPLSAPPAWQRWLASLSPWQPVEPMPGIEMDAPRPGWVFVPTPAYPGWSATVDGRPAPLHPAQVLGVALAVDAGRHEIRLAYTPIAFCAGLVIALAALPPLALLAARGSSRPGARSAASAPRDEAATSAGGR